MGESSEGSDAQEEKREGERPELKRNAEHRKKEKEKDRQKGRVYCAF